MTEYTDADLFEMIDLEVMLLGEDAVRMLNLGAEMTVGFVAERAVIIIYFPTLPGPKDTAKGNRNG